MDSPDFKLHFSSFSPRRGGTADSSQDLSHGYLNKGEEDEMEITGFRSDMTRVSVTWLFTFLTLGVLRLIYHWWPRLMLYSTCSVCGIKDAEKLLVMGNYENKYKTFFIEDVKTVSISNVDSLRDLSGNVPGGTPGKDVLDLRTVEVKKCIYVWSEEKEAFLKLTGYEKAESKELLHSFPGLSCDESAAKRSLFGENLIIVPRDSYLRLILLEALSPFYFFQVFTIIVWVLELYIFYCFAIVIMSVFGISSSVIQTRKNQDSLCQKTHSIEQVQVLRRGRCEQSPSSDLVPGDVIVIPPHGCVMQCDAVLLDGNCIVNESMVTGESVPVSKTFLPKNQEPFSVSDDVNHILYCGTQVLQARFYNNEKVRALVIRTGFSTTKGNLVRSILYPPPADYKFDQDSYKFIFILVVIGVASFSFTLVTKLTSGTPVFSSLVQALDLLTIAIPPALPAAMTVGKIHAMKRLEKQKISCINSRVINVSGSINCLCFDKTGTLTEDGLDIKGAVAVIQGKFAQPWTETQHLTDSPLLLGMATCHSLTILNGGISGDPLDLKMFELTGWSLEEPAVPDYSKYDLLVPTIVKSKDTEIGILRQFHFSSNLKRMSVITRKLWGPGMVVYCKGAPEVIISLSIPSSVPPDFHSFLSNYTKKGYRVIGIGWKELRNTPFHILQKLKRSEIEKDLHFCGLIVLENRVKPQSRPTIRALKDANIKVVMITGDNIQTAMSVARECEIVEPYEKLIEVTCSKEGSDLTAITLFDYNEMKEMRGDHHSGRVTLESLKTRQDIKLATSGNDWALIKKKFPLFSTILLSKGVVFARMSSDQKQQVITGLQKNLGLSVAMCGDGANDCCALKAANVGISLSEAEASVASPFTSREANIQCVERVIKEGRAALCTSFGVFKFMVLYSMVELTSSMLLIRIGSNLTDLQFLFIDVALIVNFAFFFGQNGAYEGPLVARPPHQSVLGICPILSLILQATVMYLFQLTSLYIVKLFPWFVPLKPGKEGLRSFENFAVYSVSQFQYIIMTICYSQGAPYRTALYKNKNLLISLILTTGVCAYLTLVHNEWIARAMELEYPPQMQFRLIILSLAIGNLVISLVCEKFIVDFVVLKYFMEIEKSALTCDIKRNWRNPEIPTDFVLGDCVQVFKSLKH